MMSTEDIWDIDIADHGQREDMDHDGDSFITMDDLPELSMPSTSSAINIRRDHTVSPHQNYATTFSSSTPSTTKTTSESADSISTFTSPSLPCYNSDSPSSNNNNNNEKMVSSFPTPIFNSQPTDSIAQMLEYMRACNSQDRPSPSFSNSFREQMHDQFDAEERNSYRKREREIQRSPIGPRKQRSPVQIVARSLSQGNEARIGTAKKDIHSPSSAHRVRQRSKTNAVPPKDGILSESRPLKSIDGTSFSISHESHAQPSGLVNPYSSFTRQYSNEGSLKSTENQTTFSWPAPQAISSSSSPQKESSNTLSLMEYLRRPEGAAWTQRFQNRPADPPSAMRNDDHIAQTPAQVPNPYVTPYPSLPPQASVSSMLGLQQAPNQALVHAFQTAFVLGMQQLGIAGQFQPHLVNSIPSQSTQHDAFQVPQSAYGPTAQYHEHVYQPSRTVPQYDARNAEEVANEPISKETESLEADRSTSILESLLHDINQQRPDEQEFSLDDFLAFVATTVENKGDENAGTSVHDKEDIVGSEAKSEDLKQVASKVEHSRQVKKSSARQELCESADKQVKTNEGIKKKPTRRRNTSLSGQLNGTHLTDVVEEGKVNDVETRTEIGEVPNALALVENLSEATSDPQASAMKSSYFEGKRPSSKQTKKRNGRTRSASNTQTLPLAIKEGVIEKEVNKLAERRRRRRESHNAVERRRRDHINERIAELASLLPESMLLDAIAASTGGGTTPHIDLSLFTRRSTVDTLVLDGDTLTAASEECQNDLERKANALAPVHSSSETLALAQSKPNKGIILSKSVDYIKHLHEFCSILRTKNKEMQREIVELKKMNSARRCPDQSMPRTAAKAKLTAEEDYAMNDATPPATISAWLGQCPNDEANSAV